MVINVEMNETEKWTFSAATAVVFTFIFIENKAASTALWK